MTSLDFAKKLNSINEKGKILEVIYTFINNVPEQYNKDDIRFFIENISEDNFTSFGNKLGLCRSHCIEELKKSDNEKETEYLQSLRKVEKLLFEFSSIYQDVVTKKKEAKETSGVGYAVAQNAAVLKEVNAKVSQFRQDLKEAKKDIKKANDSIDASTKNIDNKIFSLLINTVAILGIFVAIAFTGFGVASIISNIDLATALTSEEAFVKNIFFLLLVSVLLYNLLLLLVYFIFKLSRPLFKPKPLVNDTFGNDTPQSDTLEEEADKSFRETINLLPFYIVDGILTLFTIVSFIVCIWVW